MRSAFGVTGRVYRRPHAPSVHTFMWNAWLENRASLTVHGLRSALIRAGALAAMSSVGCSLLLDLDADQCASDAECQRFGVGSVCNRITRLCSAPPEPPPSVPPEGVAEVDAGQPETAVCRDPAGFGGRGCYLCTPTEPEHYLNACTSAQCVPFDNHAVLPGELSDGVLPLLPEAINQVDPPPSAVAADASLGATDSGSGSDTSVPADAPTEGDASVQDSEPTSDINDSTDEGPPESSLLEGGVADSPSERASGQSDDRADIPPPRPPTCTSLSNAIYIAGSSAVRPLLAAVVESLARQEAAAPTTIVYKEEGSCAAVDTIANEVPVGGTSALYWDTLDADGGVLHDRSCEIDQGGIVADIGVSDVFATTCARFSEGLPTTVLDSLGPVQTMALAVPESSTQRAISAEAAYMVFGFGKDSGIAPWTDEALIFHSAVASGAQTLVGAAIGVPAGRWRGMLNRDSEAVLESLLRAQDDPARREGAMAALPSRAVTQHRGRIRAIGFQDHRQGCAFVPDSSTDTTDKQNVRDGHYPLWGPLHFLTRLTAEGEPADPTAAKIVGYLSGTTTLPERSMMSVHVENGFVPLCAMRVTKTADGGPIVGYRPTEPCACKFEEFAGVPSSCQPCAVASECPSDRPRCSFGYCEP